MSARLGFGWSSNGDFLTPALHFLRHKPVDPTRGPTITAAIDLLGGEYEGQRIFVEDGGLPDPRPGLAAGSRHGEHGRPQKLRMILSLLPVLSGCRFLQHVMRWFARARDAGDGRLSLQGDRLHLDWDVTASRPAIDAVAAIHHKLAYVTLGSRSPRSPGPPDRI